MDHIWILSIVALLGIIGKNSTVWIAAMVLLFFSLISYKLESAQAVLRWLDAKGLYVGIIILTIGVLASIALGKIDFGGIRATATSLTGVLSVAVGILVAYIGGRGAHLLSVKPDIITGLLVGTIIGVALFRGVPVGPLIAAGILATFSGLWK